MLTSELTIRKPSGILKVSKSELQQFALFANQGLDMTTVIELVFKEHEKIVSRLKEGQKLSRVLTENTSDPYFQTLRILMDHLSVKEAIETCNFVHQSFFSLWKESLKELFYPFILFVFSFFMILFFDDYILPQMSAYTGSDHNPLISFLKILYFILFFMILMGFIFLVYLNRASLDKKRSWMSKAAGMPLFRQMNSLQFSRILQSLLNKGISTQECFEIMYTMDFNPFIYCSVDHVLKALNHGQTLEKAFESCIFFDSVFIKLTRLGLFSGSLERVLVLYNQTTMNLIREKIHKICIWIQAFSYFGVGIVVMVVYQVLLMPLEMFNSI